MTIGHRVSHRPALDWERCRTSSKTPNLRRHRPFGLIIMLGMPIAYAFGALMAWALDSVGFWVASGFGYLLFAVVAFPLAARRGSQVVGIAANPTRASESELEVIEVRCERAQSFRDLSGAPALTIEIGGDQLLLLRGAWLRDRQIYGGEFAEDLESDPRALNGLAAPFSFPANRFEITRWLTDGRVLSVEILGQPFDAEEAAIAPGVLAALPTASPSQVLRGQLDRHEAALARLIAPQAGGSIEAPSTTSRR